MILQPLSLEITTINTWACFLSVSIVIYGFLFTITTTTTMTAPTKGM